MSFTFFLKNYMSNFSKHPIIEDGIMFYTTEHYFMYHKAMTFGDTYSAGRIIATPDPWIAKEIGRGVKGYVDEVWNQKRYNVMLQGNRLKYNQHKDIREKLLATGNMILVETNPRDSIWSCGLSVEEAKNSNPALWRGQNLLGIVLMQVRNELSTGVL